MIIYDNHAYGIYSIYILYASPFTMTTFGVGPPVATARSMRIATGAGSW